MTHDSNVPVPLYHESANLSSKIRFPEIAYYITASSRSSDKHTVLYITSNNDFHWQMMSKIPGPFCPDRPPSSPQVHLALSISGYNVSVKSKSPKMYVISMALFTLTDNCPSPIAFMAWLVLSLSVLDPSSHFPWNNKVRNQRQVISNLRPGC